MAQIVKEKTDKKVTKTKKKNPVDRIKDIKIPKSVQDSIPYISVYPNGIIQTDETHFSKTYRLGEVNFKTAEQSMQESIFLDYEGLLNGLDSDVTGQITCYNRNIDSDNVRNKILMEYKSDGLNEYREEFNDIIMDKMKEGKNNIVKEKYYTVTVEAPDIETAAVRFSHIDNDVNSKILRITKTETKPMTIEERLALLYDIYNEDTGLPFSKKIAGIL